VVRVVVSETGDVVVRIRAHHQVLTLAVVVAGFIVAAVGEKVKKNFLFLFIDDTTTKRIITLLLTTLPVVTIHITLNG
jgi:hypothetical protein